MGLNGINVYGLHFFCWGWKSLRALFECRNQRLLLRRRTGQLLRLWMQRFDEPRVDLWTRFLNSANWRIRRWIFVSGLWFGWCILKLLYFFTVLSATLLFSSKKKNCNFCLLLTWERGKEKSSTLSMTIIRFLCFVLIMWVQKIFGKKKGATFVMCLHSSIHFYYASSQ